MPADRLALFDALLWGISAPSPRAMTSARSPAADQSEREPRTLEVAPPVTRDVVRTVAAAAIGLNIVLSLIDVWRLAYLPVGPGALRAAAIAATLAVPLHIRHVVFGLRGERPPAGGWTLAVLAIVNVVALQFVGHGWIFQFASLAVSILIVVPEPWGMLVVGAVALSPLLLVGTHWFTANPLDAGAYLTFAVTWRATTQYVPLRMLAAIRALDTAGRELEARAVVQARVRIDGELRTGVARALQHIAALGDHARTTAESDPSRGAAELRRLVNDSRGALADARRIVAGYRSSSLRAELDAAVALLEASGASVNIVAADGIVLDAPDDHARRAIRAALAQALREQPQANYRVEVTRDAAGAVTVAMTSDESSPVGVRKNAEI